MESGGRISRGKMDKLILISNISSILGAIISGIGFYFGLQQLKKVKRSADAARAAADSTRMALGKISAIEACAATIQQMEELKGYHRRNQLTELPERYAKVRLKLVEIKADIPDATDIVFFDSAIESYAKMERDHDAASKKNAKFIVDFDKVNATITKQTSHLTGVAARLRKQV